MNLLLSSILIFIFLSPGLIFRFSYLQGTYAKINFRISAIDEIFWAVIPAVLFQLLSFLFITHILDYPIRLHLIYNLLAGFRIEGNEFDELQAGILPFLIHFLALIALSILCGRMLRFTIRKLKLDARYKFFRLNNEWYYLFSGEILDFPGVPGSSENIEIIQVDLIANTIEGSVIYSGILQDYYLSKDNGLDRIYLSQVYRRKLKDDLISDSDNEPTRQLDVRYYKMPGELFVIGYDKIINLNITYHRFAGDGDEATSGDE